MAATGGRGLKTLRIKQGPLPQLRLSPMSWHMDEVFSVGLKSTIDELQTIPSNLKWQARACSRLLSRTLRSIMMRLVGQPDGILARVIAEIAHDLLAFRAAIH